MLSQSPIGKLLFDGIHRGLLFQILDQFRYTRSDFVQPLVVHTRDLQVGFEVSHFIACLTDLDAAQNRQRFSFANLLSRMDQYLLDRTSDRHAQVQHV